MNVNTPKGSDEVIVNGVAFKHEDMFKVIDQFYTLIQSDSLLKVPFASVHDWPDHIVRLTHFWWIRFGGKPYLPFVSYNPVEKHFFAGFNQEFLQRWLMLFHNTLEKNLSPQQAELWTLISQRMGSALSLKNEHYTRAHNEEHDNQ